MTQTAWKERYLYQVVATDPDNDVLTYTLGTVTPAPAGGNSDPLTLNATTGLLTWTPLAADVKSFSISLSVSDGRGGTFTQTYTLNVVDQANDHPPVPTADTYEAETPTTGRSRPVNGSMIAVRSSTCPVTGL